MKSVHMRWSLRDRGIDMYFLKFSLSVACAVLLLNVLACSDFSASKIIDNATALVPGNSEVRQEMPPTPRATTASPAIKNPTRVPRLSPTATPTPAETPFATPPPTWTPEPTRTPRPTSTTGPTRTRQPTQTPIPSLVERVFELTNRERERRGLQPLKADDALVRAATKHSEWLINTGRLSHTGAGGSSPRERIIDEGFVGGWTGENIYMWVGYTGGQDLAEVAVRWWMGSPAHRRNILKGEYDRLGVGVVQRGQRTYITQNFGGR